MFKNLSLRIKLTAAFFVMALLLAGVSFYQIRSVQQFNDLFIGAIGADFSRLGALDDVKLQSAKVRDQLFAFEQSIAANKPALAQTQAAGVTSALVNLKNSVAAYQKKA
ncbi:MAG TPA: hypothetical protein VNG90_00165, partial [Candidatus Acidoferrum sp.]|nr:hypothetical protein [Candidatus Acidoferrum sp.]